MEEKIFETLRSIGLNKNETIIYMDLVTYNTSSALNIARRTKLHRANTYDALKKLIEKGFVTEILRGEKRLFKALEFERLRFYLKQKEKEIEEIIPLMKSLVSQDIDRKEEVILSKGIFSLKNSLMHSLEDTKRIEIYGIPPNFLDILGDGFFNELNKQRIKNKIYLRLIFKQKPENIEQLNKISLLETRFSGLSYNSLTMIAIFDEEIMMIVPVNPFSIINVINKDISIAYREYFNILWNHSTKL